MIDEVLNEIRQAEARADEIQKEAYQQGKDIVLNAEIEAERQRKMTLSECKADQKSAVAQAEAKAKEEREVILKKGAKAAEKLIEDNNSLIEECANKVLAMLIDKYCQQEAIPEEEDVAEEEAE